MTTYLVRRELLTVEVTVGPGLPSFTCIGFGDQANRELREQLREYVISHLGADWPECRITMNVAPAINRNSAVLRDFIPQIANAILEADGQNLG